MAAFVQRNRWRKGKWLVIDDDSGFVRYSDQVARQWDGQIVDRRNVELPDPQWYITAKADPEALPFVRPDRELGLICRTISPYDAAGRLLKRFPGYDTLVATGVGSMQIGCSFTVFEDNGPFPS